MNQKGLGGLWFKSTTLLDGLSASHYVRTQCVLSQVVFLAFWFFAVLGIEPKTLHTLGRYSITELYFQPLIGCFFPKQVTANLLAPRFLEPCLSSHQKVEFNVSSLWAWARFSDYLLMKSYLIQWAKTMLHDFQGYMEKVIQCQSASLLTLCLGTQHLVVREPKLPTWSSHGKVPVEGN